MEPATTFSLVVRALLALAATHVALWLLARGLGLRLERGAVLVGLVVVGGFLAPWLDGHTIPAPLGLLGHLPTATPAVESPHDTLNDVVYQLLPWEADVRRAFAEGRLPLWSDRLDGGSSPWVNPQAGVLSPIAMLARLLPLLFFPLAALAVKMLIAFHGTWLLARASGTGRGAALVGAIGFTLGGGLQAWALFPSSSAAAWTPWLVLGTLRLLRSRDDGEPRVVVTTAAITAALLLSGYVQVAVPTAALAALAGLALGRRARFRRTLPAAALAGLFGVGLAAPHLVPFLDATTHSVRAQSVAEQPAPRADGWWLAPERRVALSGPLHPHRYGLPYADEPPIGDWPSLASTYSGLVVLAGAALAAVAWRRRAGPWLGVAAGGFLLVASWTPLAWPLSRLPLVSASDSSRYLPILGLALCVAAAHGVERWLRSTRRRLVMPIVGLGAASVAAGGGHVDVALGIWIALGLLALARSPRAVLVAALVVLSCADLVPWGRSLLPRASLDAARVDGPILAELRDAVGEHGRAAARERLAFPSLLPLVGIADARPHNPLADADQLLVLGLALGYDLASEGYFPPLRCPEHPLLDFLGVRALVSHVSLGVPDGFERSPTIDGPWRLDHNPDALPPWFLARGVEPIDELAPWLATMDDPWTVGVPRDRFDPAFALPGAPDSPLSEVETQPGRVVLDLPAGDGPRVLATSWPCRGWTARGDGATLRSIVVNGAFAGFEVPPGTRRVELRFVPPGLWAGSLLALAALVGLGLFGSLSARPRQ